MTLDLKQMLIKGKRQFLSQTQPLFMLNVITWLRTEPSGGLM